MDNIVNKDETNMFYLFSGHDTNVANVWKHLNPKNFF